MGAGAFPPATATRQQAGRLPRPGRLAVWRGPERLTALAGWGESIDAGFFNDRTTVILGDHPTVGG